jgi:hypothetical protein
VPSDDRPDPSQPLREVLDEEQVEFLRERNEEPEFQNLLDKSLKDILGSDDDPDLGELLDQL